MSPATMRVGITAGIMGIMIVVGFLVVCLLLFTEGHAETHHFNIIRFENESCPANDAIDDNHIVLREQQCHTFKIPHRELWQSFLLTESNRKSGQRNYTCEMRTWPIIGCKGDELARVYLPDLRNHTYPICVGDVTKNESIPEWDDRVHQEVTVDYGIPTAQSVQIDCQAPSSQSFSSNATRRDLRFRRWNRVGG